MTDPFCDSTFFLMFFVHVMRDLEMLKSVRTAILAGFCLGVSATIAAGDTAAAEPTPIPEIMETAFKGGLAKKVAAGEANDQEKRELLSLVIDLMENDPPQGDPVRWKTMTGKLMTDAAKMVLGREGAGEELTKSMNCKACHEHYKP